MTRYFATFIAILSYPICAMLALSSPVPAQTDPENWHEGALYYCTGEQTVTEGNNYFDTGVFPIKLGLEIGSNSLRVYLLDGDEFKLSLTSHGEYLKTLSSADVTVNPFFINIFQSSAIDNPSGDNVSGAYHTLNFDRYGLELYFHVQNWNYETRGDDFDAENYTYEIYSDCSAK